MHLSSVRPSVCLSVLAWTSAAKKIAAGARLPADIDRLLHGALQRGGRMRVVPRSPRT